MSDIISQQMRSAGEILAELEATMLSGQVERCRTLLGELDDVQDSLRKEAAKSFSTRGGQSKPLVDRAAAGEIGMGMLHVACLGSNVEVVKLVLARGPDLLKEDGKQRMPLHCAAASGSLAVVKALCAKLDERGWTAKSLLVRDSRQLSPLHLACGRPQVLGFLCRYARSTEQIWSNQGLVQRCITSACSAECLSILSSPFGTSDKKECASIIEKELRKIEASEEGVLILAIERGCFETVQLIFELGADPSLCDSEGQNALHWAAFLGHTEIYLWLKSLPIGNTLESKTDDQGKLPVDYLIDEDEAPEIDLASDKIEQTVSRISFHELANSEIQVDNEESKNQGCMAQNRQQKHEEDCSSKSWRCQEADLAAMTADVFGTEQDRDSEDDEDEDDKSVNNNSNEISANKVECDNLQRKQLGPEVEAILCGTEPPVPPQGFEVPSSSPQVSPLVESGSKLWKHDREELEKLMGEPLI